ncbi:PH domain-containing protein [Aliidiomarina indica]|uniref:PH domain-containing protein n=1 Tax=Aliidiomarina indica TaxID=2749147 RepID=UPI00188E89E1|nr:PH domain-containing protein [Aliidiomarina indica]
MEELKWQHVSPRYVSLLRIDKSILCGLILIVVSLPAILVDAVPLWAAGIFWGALFVLWLILIFLWAPRRFRVTAFATEPKEVHFRVGALWYRHTAVTHNRIQHLEIEQSPFERMLGLARLIIFTAGGSGADLTIPGLARDDAMALRDELLSMIRDEQLDEAAITEAGPVSSDAKSGDATNE